MQLSNLTQSSRCQRAESLDRARNCISDRRCWCGQPRDHTLKTTALQFIDLSCKSTDSLGCDYTGTILPLSLTLYMSIEPFILSKVFIVQRASECRTSNMATTDEWAPCCPQAPGRLWHAAFALRALPTGKKEEVSLESLEGWRLEGLGKATDHWRNTNLTLSKPTTKQPFLEWLAPEKGDLLKCRARCFCVLGLGHLAGAGECSDSGLEPPFSPTGLWIIETLATHSHANLWTLRADVKHLVLFLLTCKELMQLFLKEKGRVGLREGWRWRGRGEGRDGWIPERKVYLNDFLS